MGEKRHINEIPPKILGQSRVFLSLCVFFLLPTFSTLRDVASVTSGAPPGISLCWALCPKPRRREALPGRQRQDEVNHSHSGTTWWHIKNQKSTRKICPEWGPRNATKKPRKSHEKVTSKNVTSNEKSSQKTRPSNPCSFLLFLSPSSRPKGPSHTKNLRVVVNLLRVVNLVRIVLVGCTRRASYSEKGRVFAAFYERLPSKNPSKNLVFYCKPLQAPSKNPSKKHLPLKNLLTTLLRSVRLHDPLGVHPS